MLYPQVDLKQWIAQYQISERSASCPHCQSVLIFNIPIAMKNYRGLETSPCSSCGEISGIFRVVPVGEALEFWESLRPELK